MIKPREMFLNNLILLVQNIDLNHHLFTFGKNKNFIYYTLYYICVNHCDAKKAPGKVFANYLYSNSRQNSKYFIAINYNWIPNKDYHEKQINFLKHYFLTSINKLTNLQTCYFDVQYFWKKWITK